MSNILPKDSCKVSYTLKITVSKQFDNFAKRALRVTKTGTSRIHYTAVHLILEYAPLFWEPYRQADIRALENVQRR